MSSRYSVDVENANTEALGFKKRKVQEQIVDLIWPCISTFLIEDTAGYLTRDDPTTVKSTMTRAVSNWLSRRKKATDQDKLNVRKKAYKVMSEYLLKQLGAEVYKEGLK